MLRIGRNRHYGNVDTRYGQHEYVSLTSDARKLGTYIVGTTGTGKSSLLVNLVLQDIQAGEGVAVLDPHGDLLLDIIARTPEQRLPYIVLFDPADDKKPQGLNFLDCDKNDPRAVDLVVTNVIDTLYKLFETSWGPRMEDLLRHGILSLLYNPEPVSLLHLMMILISKRQRDKLTAKAVENDPVLRAYWKEQFPTGRTLDDNTYIKNRDEIELVGSSLNKIGRFLANPVIRRIVAQPYSTLNFRQAMDRGSIVLINLSKGDLGSDNSKFLGAVLVNQFLIAALSRRNVPMSERRPFHLYVDEYQNFATKTFPDLQSEARKYGIDTTVAHQYRGQLDLLNQGSSLNATNIIALRVNSMDAKELAGQFDNAPPPPDWKYDPIRYKVAADEEGDIYSPVKTDYSGQVLERKVYEQPRTYSDVQLETANELSQQASYTAHCRILEPGDRPKELVQMVAELLPIASVNPRVAERNMTYVRDQARKRARFTTAEIDEYIKQQMDFELMKVMDIEDLPPILP